MGFLDSLNNKNKLGKYSLESDKVEIIKIKEVLKDQEECLWFISSSIFLIFSILPLSFSSISFFSKKTFKLIFEIGTLS